MGESANRALHELLSERALLSPGRLDEALREATARRLPLEQVLLERRDLAPAVCRELLLVRRRQGHGCVDCARMTYVLAREDPAAVPCETCGGRLEAPRAGVSGVLPRPPGRLTQRPGASGASPRPPAPPLGALTSRAPGPAVSGAHARGPAVTGAHRRAPTVTGAHPRGPAVSGGHPRPAQAASGPAPRPQDPRLTRRPPPPPRRTVRAEDAPATASGAHPRLTRRPAPPPAGRAEAEPLDEGRLRGLIRKEVEEHVGKLQIARRAGHAAREQARRTLRQLLEGEDLVELTHQLGERTLALEQALREVKATAEGVEARVTERLRLELVEEGVPRAAREQITHEALQEVRKRLAQDDVTSLVDGMFQRALKILDARLEADGLLGLTARIDERAAAVAADVVRSEEAPRAREQAVSAATDALEAARAALREELEREVAARVGRFPSPDEARAAASQAAAAEVARASEALEATQRAVVGRLELLEEATHERREELAAVRGELARGLTRNRTDRRARPQARRAWGRAVRRRLPLAAATFAALAALLVGGLALLPPLFVAEASVGVTGYAPYLGPADRLVATATAPDALAALAERVGASATRTPLEQARDLLVGAAPAPAGLAVRVDALRRGEGVDLLSLRTTAASEAAAVAAADALAARLLAEASALAALSGQEGEPAPLALQLPARAVERVSALRRLPAALGLALLLALALAALAELRRDVFHDPVEAIETLGLPLAGVVGGDAA